MANEILDTGRDRHQSLAALGVRSSANITVRDRLFFVDFSMMPRSRRRLHVYWSLPAAKVLVSPHVSLLPQVIDGGLQRRLTFVVNTVGQPHEGRPRNACSVPAIWANSPSGPRIYTWEQSAPRT